MVPLLGRAFLSQFVAHQLISPRHQTPGTIVLEFLKSTFTKPFGFIWSLLKISFV